ncbi:MAG: tyrosine--tRNA ligase [Paracoccaceae bacterium]|nr:tyrosine--tRNA ligase [Paracoccaceae bacterium]
MNYNPKSEFLKIMLERGFLADCTSYERMDSALLSGVVPGYIGFDATASSLHVGSLMQIMMLRWLQKTGHQPIVLMGGGTTKVGDPSFRADERPLLTSEKINENIHGIKSVFQNYVDFNQTDNTAIMVNNAEWLDSLNYLDFLRDIGRHFSVNRMLSFESVKSRLDREQSLSFLEFNYMILQAYDFMELYSRYGCLLQMGGSDQWGNIINGIDLTRRTLSTEVFGITSPLLETSDGKKMGKSQDGAIWLDKNLVSSYQFWQFWRNTSDADVGRFLKLYTELPLSECKKLQSLRGAEINEAKIILANEVTKLLHGEEASLTAQKTSIDVFERGGSGDQLPTLEVTLEEASSGISVVQLIVRTGLASSGKEAKRLISESGAKMNDKIISNHAIVITHEDLLEDIKLSAGKKRHALVKLSN